MAKNKRGNDRVFNSPPHMDGYKFSIRFRPLERDMWFELRDGVLWHITDAFTAALSRKEELRCIVPMAGVKFNTKKTGSEEEILKKELLIAAKDFISKRYGENHAAIRNEDGSLRDMSRLFTRRY